MARIELNAEDLNRHLRVCLGKDVENTIVEPRYKGVGCITVTLNCSHQARLPFFDKIEKYCKNNGLKYSRHSKKIKKCSIGGAYIQKTLVILKGNKRDNRTVHEDRNVDAINRRLIEIMSRDGTNYVRIKIGNESFDVSSCEKFVGRTHKSKYGLQYDPKCDFYLKDVDGNPLVFISHKNGTKARDFQNWAGISEKGSTRVYSHKSTQRFIEALRMKYPGGMEKGCRALAMKIASEDSEITLMSVYGEDYGKEKGWNNVHLVLQGEVTIVGSKDNYSLMASHVLTNGTIPTGGYEPVFMARYVGDRDNFVKYCRAGIFPKDYRRNPGWV